MIVDLHVLPMATPTDVTGLHDLLATVPAEDVVAVLGKTEGSGLADDPNRARAAGAVVAEIAAALGVPAAEAAERVRLILSGGAPGVLTPHIAVITRRTAPPGPGPGRLAVGTAASAGIRPEHIGRLPHVHTVAAAVRRALDDAAITDPADVHLVLVKTPTLTEDGIAAAAAAGHDTVTTDLGLGPDGAMCYANDAAALGVAAALGETDPETLRDDAIRRVWSRYSDVAMTSAAAEKTHAEVVVLGNSTAATGSLRIGHRSMRDILDLAAVPAAVAAAAPGGERADLVYLLLKMIIPGGRRLGGHRITLHDDPHAPAIAKAMGGYLLAATTGRTMSFVSGGERNSHQGPPDGNPLAAIVRVR